jgi:signal peptidase I
LLDFTILRPYNVFIPSAMRKFFVSFLEVLEIALIAVVAVYLVRTFLVQPFLVSGSSMVPNFQDGNYVLVDEFTYRIHQPTRGDVIVFHDPQDWSTYFIKRVIGLPNEKIEIANNKITVFNQADPNGLTLDESYLPAGTPVSANACDGGQFSASGTCIYMLASSTYLAFGDNRAESYDSRSWGPLPEKNIVGLVRVRLWPINEIGAFSAPNYQ